MTTTTGRRRATTRASRAASPSGSCSSPPGPSGQRASSRLRTWLGRRCSVEGAGGGGGGEQGRAKAASVESTVAVVGGDGSFVGRAAACTILVSPRAPARPPPSTHRAATPLLPVSRRPMRSTRASKGLSDGLGLLAIDRGCQQLWRCSRADPALRARGAGARALRQRRLSRLPVALNPSASSKVLDRAGLGWRSARRMSWPGRPGQDRDQPRTGGRTRP